MLVATSKGTQSLKQYFGNVTKQIDYYNLQQLKKPANPWEREGFGFQSYPLIIVKCTIFSEKS